MLINLSNHSFADWQVEQIQTAEELYGEIFDLKFPDIPPAAEKSKIDQFVDIYINKCLLILDKEDIENCAVHIMGEHTFTYGMINKLKSVGIKCIASTTSSNSNCVGNKKTSLFHFVGFREY